MRPYFQTREVQLYLGDARMVLAAIPERSVDAVITSPPYWSTRHYGNPLAYFDDGWHGELGLEADPQQYAEHVNEVLAWLPPVMSPGATLWLVLGDTYFGDSPVRAGAHEAFSTRWDAAQTRSRGGPRRSAARLGDLTIKSLTGAPWRIAFGLQARGWTLRAEIIWHKPNAVPGGRVKDRPYVNHERIFLLSRAKRYRYYRDADPAGARSFWSILTTKSDAGHPATFPIELSSRMVKLATKPDHLVLDPFAGSSTTLVAALQLGRRAIGIEIDERYCERAAERLRRMVIA